MCVGLLSRAVRTSRSACLCRCMASMTSVRESTATQTRGGTAQKSLTSSRSRCALLAPISTLHLGRYFICSSYLGRHLQEHVVDMHRRRFTHAVCLTNLTYIRRLCAGIGRWKGAVCTRRPLSRPSNVRPGGSPSWRSPVSARGIFLA